jgi:anti-sigma factor RsiW
MGTEALHDLTPAYALDALDPTERREYEAHLALCERCRAELASLSEAASALAYGVEAPAPPPQLRARILDSARAERANVVPLRPRWAIPAAVTAVAAVAAVIALAIWASSLSGKVDRLQARNDKSERVAAVLGAPGAHRFQIPARGTLVVAPRGSAALVLTNLHAARSGMLYEAWVSTGGKPKPAGTFDATGPLTAVPLDQAVPTGAIVMVTQEKHRVEAPTTTPFIRVTA